METEKEEENGTKKERMRSELGGRKLWEEEESFWGLLKGEIILVKQGV